MPIRKPEGARKKKSQQIARLNATHDIKMQCLLRAHSNVDNMTGDQMKGGQKTHNSRCSCLLGCFYPRIPGHDYCPYCREPSRGLRPEDTCICLCEGCNLAGDLEKVSNAGERERSDSLRRHYTGESYRAFPDEKYGWTPGYDGWKWQGSKATMDGAGGQASKSWGSGHWTGWTDWRYGQQWAGSKEWGHRWAASHGGWSSSKDWGNGENDASSSSSPSSSPSSSSSSS